MEISWKAIWPKARKWLRPAALAAAGVVAVYVGALQPLSRERGQERIAAFLGQEPATVSGVASGVSGGIAESEEEDGAVGGVQVAALNSPAPAPPPAAAPDSSDRKMVRTDALDLVVKHPAVAAEQIRQLASRLGGFLVTSDVSGDADAASASLTIRVPAAQFEEARAEIRKLGLRVVERTRRRAGCHPAIRGPGRTPAQPARRGAAISGHPQARRHGERHARGQREAQRSAR